MLKDVLEKELQELELDDEKVYEQFAEDLACGMGAPGPGGNCSGSCGGGSSASTVPLG